MILSLAKYTQPDFRKQARNSGKAVFVCIPYSHYVDFARFSLQLTKKLKFVEEDYAPGQHILPVLNLRLNGPTKIISTSSSVQSVKSNDDANVSKKGKGLTSVPVLVHSDGRVISDSWSIAEESGLKPIEDPAVQKILDEELGPLSRQYIYGFLLKPDNKKIWDGLCTDGRHWFWQLLWHFGMGWFLTKKLTAVFQSINEIARKECREKLVHVFEKIGATRIKNRKGTFINGDEITIEDVAAAALASPAVCPPLYCEGRFAKWFNLLEEQDAELRDDLKYWRSTELGKYAMDFYRDHRMS